MTDILLTHFAAYPLMRPQDAVKLLYQREFGPGHLIKSRETALTLLRREMAGLSPARPGEALYEPIGGGLCRLNLRPCQAKGMPAEDICALFCDAAATVRGDPRRFRQSLQTLRQWAEEEETPFDAAELEMFLLPYLEAGCPALHHSAAYQAAYAPAYRVVKQRQLREALAQKREGEKRSWRANP